MAFSELWLTYHIASRAIKPATAQLVELEFQNNKLSDLEDIVDHIFKQGFVDAKFRSMTWWETKQGLRLKGSHGVEALLSEGAGRSPETALRLIIEDVSSALWFKYVYLHGPNERSVVQRIKFDTFATRPERLAHVTNHIFNAGYLPCKYRPVVHWEGIYGKKVEEYSLVNELLHLGEGHSEDKPLRLVIDDAQFHEHAVHSQPHHLHHAHCSQSFCHGH